MTDYSAMSVEELLDAYVSCINSGWGNWVDRLLEIKSALRKAVIREASVAEIILITDYVGEYEEPTPSYCVEDGHADEDVTYCIIPKETP